MNHQHRRTVSVLIWKNEVTSFFRLTWKRWRLFLYADFHCTASCTGYRREEKVYYSKSVIFFFIFTASHVCIPGPYRSIWSQWTDWRPQGTLDIRGQFPGWLVIIGRWPTWANWRWDKSWIRRGTQGIDICWKEKRFTSACCIGPRRFKIVHKVLTLSKLPMITGWIDVFVNKCDP